MSRNSTAAQTAAHSASPAPQLLDEGAAASILCVSKRTLQLWRRSGNGPAFVKLGAAVRYRPSDLDEFIEANLRSNTAQSKAN